MHDAVAHNLALFNLSQHDEPPTLSSSYLVWFLFKCVLGVVGALKENVNNVVSN